jgi:hypothetical protein
VQWVGTEIRVLDYYESVGQVLAFHVNWLRSRGYQHAVLYLPHDGIAANSVTGKRYEDHLREAGFTVEPPVKNQGRGAAMMRIEALRRLGPQIWWNENTTEAGRVPRSAWQVSTRSSPKKCDFPEPRPPKAPLYRAGWSSGSKTLAVGIFRVDNDALNLMDQFKGTVVGVLKRLRGLTPAAVENGVGGGDARGRGRILASHDADQHVDRRPGVAASQRADFGDGSFCHLLLVPIGLHAVARHKIGMLCRGAVRHRRAECDGRKIRLFAVAFRARNEVDDFCRHANASHNARAIRPASASDIRYAVMRVSLLSETLED